MNEETVLLTTKEIYERLYDHAEIYRPPQERDSAFLEISYGCSYAACNFCDFIKDPFKTYSLDQVEYKLSLLRYVIGDRTRIHLLGCDPLCLPADYLLQVLKLYKAYIPQITEFSMYARSDDILLKTEDELRALKAEGLADLHVGLESGSDRILKLQNKGETIAQIVSSLKILESIGIGYHLSLIPGLGGLELSEEHAVKTAKALSLLRPKTIWCMGLKIWEGTPLYDMMQAGSFHPLDFRQLLEEERLMLSLTDMNGCQCVYTDSTALGKYTIRGVLPDGKAKLLAVIDQLLLEDASEG